MKNNVFERRPIGHPDLKKREMIIKRYETLIDTANVMKFSFEELINEESVNIDLFHDFLKSEPENWLISHYVAAKGINVPGINTEKLIELKLVDIPDYSEIIKVRIEFDTEMAKLSEQRFVYPLKKLYIENGNVFNFTDEFHFELNEYTTRYTQNEKQNQILDTLEDFARVINKFNEFGIININSMGLTFLDPEISQFWVVDRKNHENPISVNPIAFKIRKLRRFFEGSFFGSNMLGTNLLD